MDRRIAPRRTACVYGMNERDAAANAFIHICIDMTFQLNSHQPIHMHSAHITHDIVIGECGFDSLDLSLARSVFFVAILILKKLASVLWCCWEGIYEIRIWQEKVVSMCLCIWCDCMHEKWYLIGIN